MQTAKYVDTPQQTAVIEMPAGVWSKSLNTVYHNETLRGRRWRSPSLRSDDPLGFLTPPNRNTAVHVSTLGDRHTFSLVATTKRHWVYLHSLRGQRETKD